MKRDEIQKHLRAVEDLIATCETKRELVELNTAISLLQHMVERAAYEKAHGVAPGPQSPPTQYFRREYA